MLSKLLPFFAWLAVFVGLALPTILPEVTNVTTLAMMGIGLIALIVERESRSVMRHPAAWLPLVAGLALVLALAVTAKTPTHVLAIVVFAPLLLIGPHAVLLGQLGLRLTPTVIGVLALLGTGAGAAVTAYGVFVLGLARGGFLINNPIHLADLALMLGFVALVGLFARWRVWRAVFLLGPVLALVTVLLSDSRGPMVAFVPMAISAGAVLAWRLLPRRWIAPSLLIIVLLIGAGGYALAVTGLGGRLSTLGEVFGAFEGGAVVDGSTSERLYMYRSAWNAFMASPWFGHGLIDFAIIASHYAPVGPISYPPYDHLHNDIADFAVIGGVLGLLAYGLILVAPLVGASSGRGANRGALWYLGIVTPVGYLSMGLTNAMIGILTQTTLYAVILALIIALGRGKDEHQKPNE